MTDTMKLNKGAVKSIYALGAKLGMVERDAGHEDALHQLIAGLDNALETSLVNAGKEKQGLFLALLFSSATSFFFSSGIS